MLHYYGYGRLYNTSTKIIARTTSQDRMMKSAEYWLAGCKLFPLFVFLLSLNSRLTLTVFGQEWTNNATLEVILEDPAGSNNSLAGYFGCNNSNTYVSTGGNNASRIWEKTYLADARERFSAATKGYNWTIADVYNVSVHGTSRKPRPANVPQAQTLCPYETVAFGYSAFCDLFTYEEWQGFEYTIDLQFYGNNGFGSPTGRGVGIGYVEELVRAPSPSQFSLSSPSPRLTTQLHQYARLQNHLYNLPAGATQANVTLDTMNATFPLNQTLYFDFSHDTNIYSIITALGLRQFNQSLPTSGPPADQQAVVSHMTPFAARMLWEIIAAPHPVNPTRPTNASSAEDYYNITGSPTMYVHQTLGQRTIPLWKSYPECEERDDGWCELGTYLDVMGGLLEEARYEESCWGSYPSAAWGEISDGVPLEERGSGNATQGQVKRMLGARSLAWLAAEERVE